jgi:hypothetical protein
MVVRRCRTACVANRQMGRREIGDPANGAGLIALQFQVARLGSVVGCTDGIERKLCSYTPYCFGCAKI